MRVGELSKKQKTNRRYVLAIQIAQYLFSGDAHTQMQLKIVAVQEKEDKEVKSMAENTLGMLE